MSTAKVAKQTATGLTGNSAVAYAMMQINPDVCGAYPITPSTTVIEEFSSYVADGRVDTGLITVESEHSAMSACIGAASAGARAMSATSSQGLALMWEMLYIASGMRLPIVLCDVNRALSAPINIHCDHSDTMGARDSGWIQLYSETVQEAYDNMIQAVRIAEDKRVQLPIMVCLDGFITSHSIENIELLDDESVQDFVGEYKPERSLLDVDNPLTLGATALQDSYMPLKHQQSNAMKASKEVVIEIGKEFGEVSGRSYGLLEEYDLDDAEVAIVVLSSSAGTVKDAVDKLRAEGKKVGVLRPRLFRPFPHKEIAKALSGKKAVCVLDRADSMDGFGGPLFKDIRAALYADDNRPKIIGRVFGLGGADFNVDNALDVIGETIKLAAGEDVELFRYIGEGQNAQTIAGC